MSSSAPLTGTFLAEYYAGCKCGLFTPTCSSARQILNLSPTEVTVSSISVNVPNPVEWTQAYRDPLFASGHAYLMVKVPVNSISTTITTCTTETASSIVDTHLRISFRCPSASTYIEGNEYLIDTNDDTQSGSYCSTVIAGSEASSNTIYAVVQAGKLAAKDASKRIFGATVEFGCACGWSGAYCDIPAIPLTLNLPTLPVGAGNAFNFSWIINKATAGAMTALTYSKTGDEYVPLMLEVDQHTSFVFVTTCAVATQENVRNALLYTASSNPVLFPSALDGATQMVCNGVNALGSKSPIDQKGDAFCTPWQKLSYSRSLRGYQLLIAANGKSFDASSSGVFGISSRVQCECDWGDGISAGCNSPFGVRVGCTDTRKNIAGAALCAPSGRLTFPSTWPNVFGFSDGGIIFDEEPTAVITLTLSDNAEESLPSTVMISTLDPVTSDPATGLVKTSMWVYKGCARGGVPLREQTWTLVAYSNGTGLIPDSSTVILSNPTDRVYYVVVKGRQGSANAGKMKQFGLTWTQVLPTPSPSSFPTYRPPTPTRSVTSSSSKSPTPSSTPRSVVKVDLRLEGVPMSVLSSSECASTPLTCPLLFLRRGVSLVTKESLADVIIDSIRDSESGVTMSRGEGNADSNPLWKVSQVLSRRLLSLNSRNGDERLLQGVGPGSITSFSITSRSTSSDAIAGSMKKLSTNTTVAAFLDAMGANGLLFKNSLSAKGFSISSIGSSATIYAPGQASANPTPSVTPSPRYIITIPGGGNSSGDGTSSGTVTGVIGGVVGVILLGAIGYYLRNKSFSQKKILMTENFDEDNDEGAFEGENVHAGKSHISIKSKKKSAGGSKRKDNKNRSTSSAISELSAAAIDVVGGTAAMLSSSSPFGQGFSAVSAKESIPDKDGNVFENTNDDDDENDIGRGRLHQRDTRLFDVEDNDDDEHVSSSIVNEGQKINESNISSGARRESALGLLSRRRSSSVQSMGSPIMPSKLFPSAWGEGQQNPGTTLAHQVDSTTQQFSSSSKSIKSKEPDKFIAPPIIVTEGEESDDSDAEIDIYSGMGLAELKDECLSRLLSTNSTGRKPSQELRRRLRMDDELAARRATALKAKEAAALAKKAALEKLAAAKESKRVAAEKAQQVADNRLQEMEHVQREESHSHAQGVDHPLNLAESLSILSSSETIKTREENRSVANHDDVFDSISQGLFPQEEGGVQPIQSKTALDLQIEREREVHLARETQQLQQQTGFSIPSFFSSSLPVPSVASTTQRPFSTQRPLSASNWFRSSSEKIVPMAILSTEMQRTLPPSLQPLERPATAQALSTYAMDRPERDVIQTRPTTSSNIASRTGARSLAPIELNPSVESQPRKGGWGVQAKVDVGSSESIRWSPSVQSQSSTLSSDRVDALDESLDYASIAGRGGGGAPVSLSPIRNVKKQTLLGRNEIENIVTDGHHQLPFSLGWANDSEGEGGLDVLSRYDHGLKPLVLTKTVSSSMLTQSVTIAREELRPVVTHKSPPSNVITMPAHSYKDDDEIVVVHDADDLGSTTEAPSRKPKGKKKKKKVDAFVAEVSTLEVDEIDD